MKNWIWLAALLMGFGFSNSSLAVHLDHGGRGQVLIYPYYNVTEQKQTLLSVINTLAVAQVAKVRFYEARNGRTALEFNLWLAPYDSWSGTVFATADAGSIDDGAGIATTDKSCTSPTFSSSGLNVNGTAYLPFTDTSFTGALSDGDYTALRRVKDGFVEIIAMADLAAPLAGLITAPTAFGASPPGCAQVAMLSMTDPGMSTPSGGIMGSVSIINVGRGTVLSTRAEALDGFTAVSLFTGSESDQPNLASVNDTGSPDTATASVSVKGGSVQTLTYRDTPGGSQRVDAVSAVLIATQFYNEFQRDRRLGAQSDWLLTMPTRRYYVQTFPTGPAQERPPFQTVDSLSRHLGVNWNVRDGESRRQISGGGCGFVCTPGQLPFAWTAISSAAAQGILIGPYAGELANRPLGSQNGTFLNGLQFDAGWAAVELGNSGQRRLPASVEGKVLIGLPVVGFWASNILNNNVSNGVLANYAAAVRHATSVTCVKASDGMPCD